MRRALAIVTLIVTLGAGCTSAPDPGDLAAFCLLLETGTGLTASPAAEDLERLVLVAPPGVRPTIEALQNRARDFDELLAETPPDLEALFNAKFDPQATNEQAALDRFALGSCGIAVDRPPPVRWNSWVSDNFADAAWNGLVTTQFEVPTASDRIDTATVVFADAPEPLSLVEDVCSAVAEFLIGDGADPGRIRVFVGSVVAIETDSPAGPCQLP